MQHQTGRGRANGRRTLSRRGLVGGAAFLGTAGAVAIGLGTAG
jgi:hypothetical protein